MAEGGYEPVAEVLFNELAVDGYFLEYDDARSGGFSPLRFVPEGKVIVLGIVSSKIPMLEPVKELKHRIDEAAQYHREAVRQLSAEKQIADGRSPLFHFQLTNQVSPLLSSFSTSPSPSFARAASTCFVTDSS